MRNPNTRATGRTTDARGEKWDLDRWLTPVNARREFLEQKGVSLDRVRELLQQCPHQFWGSDFQRQVATPRPESPETELTHRLARIARGYRHLPKPHWLIEDDLGVRSFGDQEGRASVTAVRTMLGMLGDLEDACRPVLAPAGGTDATPKRKTSKRALLIRDRFATTFVDSDVVAALRTGARCVAEMLGSLTTDPIPRRPLRPEDLPRRGPKLNAFGNLCQSLSLLLAKPDAMKPVLPDSKPTYEAIVRFLVGTELVPAQPDGGHQGAVAAHRLAGTVKRAIYRRIS